MYLRTAFTPQKGLYCLCGLLSAACAYEVWAPLPAVAVPDRAIAMGAPAQPSSAVFVPSPIAAFDAINERPIFSPDRKPIAPAAAATAGAATTPPPVSLVGVILDGKISMALIKSAASPLETAFAVGETIDGWQVTEIDSGKVVLRSGAATDEIKLEANRAAKSTGLSPGFVARPQMPAVNQQSSNQTATPASPVPPSNQ